MQYSTALRGTSTKLSPLPDPPWNGLLQFLKVDGEFSLKAYRADFIMFQKLFLPAAFYIIFCQEAGEDFNDDEVLQRIIAIERIFTN